ncbi:MAG: FitA-like ribbon-helix-helix domain-containing protein [Steroidobacteraceae bacterium]
MAQVVVRQLEEDLKERLKRRAKRHGRSMEAEIREILRNAVREGSSPVTKLGSRIASRFKRKGLQEDLPELRGQTPRAADLSR